VDYNCKWTQYLLRTHSRVRVLVHYNRQKKSYVDQSKDGETNTYEDGTSLEWFVTLLLLLLMMMMMMGV
jgi:hypothetical protein